MHLVLGLLALFLAFRIYRVLVATVMAMGRLFADAATREQSKKPTIVPKGVN
jgi:hypothetical protein